MDRKLKLDELARLRQAREQGKTGSEQLKELTALEENYMGEGETAIADNEMDNFIVDEQIKKTAKRGKRNEYYEEDEEYYKRLSMRERSEANKRNRRFKDLKEVKEDAPVGVVKASEHEVLESKELMEDIFAQLDEIDDDDLKKQMDVLELKERESEQRRIAEVERKLKKLENDSNRGKMEEEDIPNSGIDELGDIDFDELDAFTAEIRETERKRQQKIMETSSKKHNTGYKRPSQGSMRPVGVTSALGGNYFLEMKKTHGNVFDLSSSRNQINEEVSPFQIETVDDDGDQTTITPFYWLDIVENSRSKNMIYLIGKIKDGNNGGFKSASLAVEMNYRHVYFCKKRDAEYSDFEREVKLVMKRLTSASFCKSSDEKLITYKKVKKRYGFELDIEVDENMEVCCLEVRIPFRIRLPPVLEHSGSYYKGVIGFTHTPTELAQIHLNLNGPSWIGVQEPEIVQRGKKNTWCDVEMKINDLEEITPIRPDERPEEPRMKAVFVSYIKADDKAQNGEIDCITLLEYEANVKVCEAPNNLKPYFFSVEPLGSISSSEKNAYISKLKNTFGGNFNSSLTEYSMLRTFLEVFQRINPDLIIGHEIDSKLSVIFKRISQQEKTQNKKSNFENFSVLSRFRKSPKDFKKTNMKYKSIFIDHITSGRLVLDTYKAASEHMKEVDYSLEFLSQKYFNTSYSKVVEKQRTLLEFQSYILSKSFKEAYLSLLVVKKIQAIQLTKQLTNVAGCLWKQSLKNQRAKRNEMLLMHQFHRQNFLLPDYIKLEKTPKFEKEYNEKVKKYQGGKVFAPQKGIHHAYTILLDFNSLYPSIIRQYRLCFTTVKRTKYPLDFYTNPDKRIQYEVDMKDPEELKIAHDHNSVKIEEHTCILPKIVASLITKRKQMKVKMKKAQGEKEKAVYDIKQKALKLIANSIYGCLGFSSSRFFSKDIASMITSYGRSLIERTADLVKEKNYEVIYGDTDSVMINSRQQDLIETLRIALQLKKDINREFKGKKKQSFLEVGIDGIFKSFLIHSKKKYAAMMLDNFDLINKNMKALVTGNIRPEYKLEIKGLDFVRRDWCGLTKKAGRELLEIILNKEDMDDVLTDVYSYLETLSKKIKHKKIKLENLVIYKVLKKRPDAYKDKRSQPHVAVADRLITSKKRKLEQLLKHSIGYVICKDSNAMSIGERAFHFDELKTNKKVPDYDWYLNNQFSNPINRVIEHIHGIDMDRVSKILGTKSTVIKTQDNNSLASEGLHFYAEKLPKNYGLVKWRCRKRNETGDACGALNILDPKKPFICKKCQQGMNHYEAKNVMNSVLRKISASYYNFQQECAGCSQDMEDPFSMVQECEECGPSEEISFKYSSYDVNSDINSMIQVFEKMAKVSPPANKSLPIEKINQYKNYLRVKNFDCSSYNKISAGDFKQASDMIRMATNLKKKSKVYSLVRFNEVL